MTRLTWALILLLLPACVERIRHKPPPELELELRDKISVSMEQSGDTLTITVTPSAGYGLMAPNVALAGDGRLERFVEASSILYTARFSSPADPSGPCGNEPVSLALALHRQAGNDRVSGGLTAYCGASQWHGTPKRVLRIAGSLPLDSVP
jgi:hypothetical protein